VADSSNRPRLFKVSDLARAARVTPMTIYNHIQKGALPSVKVAGCVRIPEDAAIEYLGPEVSERLPELTEK
jgi:hypothetical protein